MEVYGQEKSAKELQAEAEKIMAAEAGGGVGGDLAGVKVWVDFWVSFLCLVYVGLVSVFVCECVCVYIYMCVCIYCLLSY